jgi:hypothetical protein
VLLPALSASGGYHSLGQSPGGGEVQRLDPLRLKCGLVLGKIIWLGHGDRLLASELALPLRSLALGIILLSTGSCLLPLPNRVPSLKRELVVR